VDSAGRASGRAFRRPDRPDQGGGPPQGRPHWL